MSMMENWKYLDEVGIQMLKNNIVRNNALVKRLFKTGKLWGYSFKERKN